MTTSSVLTPAEAFSPGEYLADELEARGWSNAGFAEIIGRPVQLVSEIINGHKEITAQTAAEIAAATETEAATWLNLQATYRLWQIGQNDACLGDLRDVSRRARLAELAPVKELRDRSLLSGDLDQQEAQLQDLFQIESLEDTPHFAVAARRSNDAGTMGAIQTTWIACALRAARKLPGMTKSSAEPVHDVAAQLTRVITEPQHLGELPGLLARAEVGFVYVPAFKGSKIDGAAFILGDRPFVAVSGRIARFDSVLFTVLHELAHIGLGHISAGALVVDEDHDDQQESSAAASIRELDANRLAGDWAVGGNFQPPGVLSRVAVLRLAQSIGVHPSLVVGRLQRDGALPWTHLNRLVPRVRPDLDRLRESLEQAAAV